MNKFNFYNFSDKHVTGGQKALISNIIRLPTLSIYTVKNSKNLWYFLIKRRLPRHSSVKLGFSILSL